MRTTDLGGHSGCQILLCETEDNEVFVRKISSSLEYNKRIIVQAQKQAEYKSNTIKTPKVLNEGYTPEGLFYFDMEYIQGITLAEYIKSMEIGKVRGMVEVIVKELINEDAEQDKVEEQIFFDKISSLRESLKAQENPIIQEAIEMLSSHSWKKFVKSTCHGDLTLENIIVKDNQLYLIDFLDSFYDCWIIDMGTLLQDVQALWSYRYQDEININALIRLIVFRDILVEKVKEVVKDDYIEIYYALLLKLIRIYPYTKDEKTYSFLNEKTVSIMEIIKKEENTCVR